jgi:hypothetical protein
MTFWLSQVEAELAQTGGVEGLEGGVP